MTGTPIRVLLIEDDAEMAFFVRTRLEEAQGTPFSVLHAASLADGMQRLAEAGPDIILLDLNLPDSIGVDTFQQVWSHTPDTPIVVLTCREDETLSDHLVAAGAQDYLVKTEVLGAVVARSLRHAIERKRAALERERLVKDLQLALAEVKTLSGLLPICSSCKKIRDDHGYWTNVESYIQSRSNAQFSHGICPDCMKKLYPGYSKRHTTG